MILPDFDPYEVLGITRKARHFEIVKVFRALSRIHHPDHGGDAEMFNRISSAYRILGSRHRRDEYDSLTPEGVLSVPEFGISGDE